MLHSKGNLQDGKDSFHVTLVKDDGEHWIDCLKKVSSQIMWWQQ